jgi:MFS family permease
MYTLLRESLQGVSGAARSTAKSSRPHVSRNVLFLGLTSLFTDISSEMVSSVLPLYFVVYLGFSPFAFGVVDGLYQGSTALVRVVGGFTADRWRRHKEVAAVGYGLSAVCKIALLAVGGAWTAITAVILLDRAGKGLRTAPRDALISLSSSPATLGVSFGVHRALDTVGALIGPLIAFGILTLAPRAFDAIFVASFCAAVIGLAMLVLFVENRTDQRTAEPERTSLRQSVGLLSRPRFLVLLVVGAVLSLCTMSDAFLYLLIQRRLDFEPGFFPILYVATAVAYFILAVPMGWIADRLGRARTFLAGHLLLVVIYVLLLRPLPGAGELVGCVLLLGAFYAATDGVLMALASSLLPEASRGTGLALLSTTTSVARLAGSILFGALWTWRGADASIAVLLTGLIVAMVVSVFALLPAERRTVHG